MVLPLIAGFARLGTLGELADRSPRHHMLRSSAIASVDYMPEAETLTVNMQNGRSYTYSDIDDATYQGLISAPSPGAYYNANIKNR